jgi:beta-glucanase (GH16 family)
MRYLKVLTILIITALTLSTLYSCSSELVSGISHLDEEKFQQYLALPDFETISANGIDGEGWYEVWTDNFDGNELDTTIWAYSPQSYRTKSLVVAHPEYTSYWSQDMVSVKDGLLQIKASQEANFTSSDGIFQSVSGRFTGGIETRYAIRDPEGVVITQETMGTDEEGNPISGKLFYQAFGYFEARVKFPNEDGLWSAFWLQSDTQGRVGDNGEDGTEIDVYESCFIKRPTGMAHALLWDGYSWDAKGSGFKDDYKDTIGNFYNDFHTFALKWTPWCYVFYVDGKATWVTDDGGVSKVAEFLRLTVEIDEGDLWGPHAQRIRSFKNKGSIFYVDYVKVYQNVNYEQYEKVISTDNELVLKNSPIV